VILVAARPHTMVCLTRRAASLSTHNGLPRSNVCTCSVLQKYSDITNCVTLKLDCELKPALLIGHECGEITG
jgi:hypothetical protein